MDVEKRTVISAGMDASPFRTGMDEVSASAAKTASSVTQSVSQISRALLDSGRGFDQLARNFVSGYKNAQDFATGVQRAYAALGDGRDKLGALPQILDGIAAKYGLMGNAARQAALVMIDSSKSSEERLRALQSMIDQSAGRAGAIIGQPTQLSPIQSTINQTVGVQAPMDATDYAARAADIAAYGNALDGLRARYDPLFNAQQQYQTQLTGIADAEKVGAITATEAGAARDRASASYRTAAVAVAANTAALQAEHEAANRALLGISDPNATATARRAADVEAYGKSLDALRASVDPVYASSKRYEDELGRIDQAEKLLLITSQRANVLRQEATTSFAAAAPNVASLGRNLDQLTGTTAQQQFAMRQLGVQTIQTFQGFATGQPIMMTLIQQGHQVVDVMVAAGVGFKSLGDAIWNFAKSLISIPAVVTTLVGAAIVAPFVAVGIAIEAANRRLIELQQQLRATRTDYDALGETVIAASREAARSTTLSTTDARTAGQVIASQPNFAGTQKELTDLIALSGDVARVFNIDIKAAAHQLATALQEPAKAAKELADKHFPGMTVAIARDVEMLQLQGRTIEAQNIVLGNYERQIKAAAEAGTPLQHALTALGQNLDLLASHIGTFANAAVSTAERLGTWIRDHPPLGFDVTGRARESAPFGTGGTPVLMNPESGAAGIMQVMPGTARMNPNLNPMSPLGNIELGVIDFQRKLTAAEGDISTALKNYGGFATKDPTAYIASVQAQDVTKLTPGIADAIERIAREKGITDQSLVTMLQRIAMQESGGNQLATTREQAMRSLEGQRFWGTQGQPPLPGLPGGAAGPPLPTTGQVGAAGVLQGRINAADTDFNTKAIEAQRQVIESTILGYTQLVGAVGDNTEAAQKYQTVIGILSGQLTNLRTPTEQNIKALRDQVGVSGFEAGAAKALADAYQALDAASNQYTGHAATAAEKETARVLVMERLAKESQVSIDVQNRQTEATRGSIGVLGQGQKALDDYNATMKAREEAFKRVGTQEGPEYERVLATITAANIATADSERAKTNATALYSATTEGQRIAIRANITELERQRDASGTTAEQAKLFNEQISIQSGVLLNLRTPLEEVNKGLKDNVDLARAGDGAARQYAEALHTATEAARQRGQASLTDAERLEVVRNVTARLNAEASTAVTALDRQTAMTNRLADATEQGGIALDHARNREQALVEVHATSRQMTIEQVQQVEALSAAMDRNSEAKRTNAAAADIHAMELEAATIAKETELLDANVEVRTHELAVLKERQKQDLLTSETGNATQQRAIALAGENAKAQLDLGQRTAAIGAVATGVSSAFDNLANAATDAFLSGAGGAVNFQNALKGILTQLAELLIKLTVINPLMNSVFPSLGLPTARGLFGGVGGGGALSGAGEAALVGSSEAALTGPVGSGLLSAGLGLAAGGVFPRGIADYHNQIVSQPTLFHAYAQGSTGLMGEAGPEAIVPLVRGPSGDLGIRSSGGGGGVSVVSNVTINAAPGGAQGNKPLDPQAIRQLTAQIDQQVTASVRKALVNELRPGGDLFLHR